VAQIIFDVAHFGYRDHPSQDVYKIHGSEFRPGLFYFNCSRWFATFALTITLRFEFGGFQGILYTI